MEDSLVKHVVYAAKMFFFGLAPKEVRKMAFLYAKSMSLRDPEAWERTEICCPKPVLDKADLFIPHSVAQTGSCITNTIFACTPVCFIAAPSLCKLVHVRLHRSTAHHL